MLSFPGQMQQGRFILKEEKKKTPVGSSKRKQIKQSYADNSWRLVTIHCSNAD